MKLQDYISPEMLENTSIRTNYSTQAQEQVSDILQNGVNDQAIHRKYVEAITIDSIESPDLDDAIWVEKTQDGYCVFIHISDVSEVVPLFSPLDIEAFERTTSIYRKGNTIDMIPPDLSYHSISLNEDEKKLTISLQIDLDNDANVINTPQFYESRFKSLKRYDYEQFGKDFTNPDSQHFNTLQLIKEVSDKLRINRIKSGSTLDFERYERRLSIGQQNSIITPQYATKTISHQIIESFMVLANQTTGQYIAKNPKVSGIYKVHDSLGERSYYANRPHSYHAGLAITDYLHFTSPIRRYPDLITHRSIKTILRKEEFPYSQEDIKLIALHANNTRWKVETLGKQIDINHRGEAFIKNTEKRNGRPIEVYDLKPHIRNSVNNSTSLPKIMREAIIERVKTGGLSHWIWSTGIILLGKDNDLKKVMREQIITHKSMGPQYFLSVLTQTQLILGEGTIFELDEHEQSQNYSVSFRYKGIIIAESDGIIQNYRDTADLKYNCRIKLIEQIFDYHIQ